MIFFCRLIAVFLNKKAYFLFIAIFLFITSYFNEANAINKHSVASGNWNNPSSWSPYGIPAIGDNVIILSNHIITVDNNAEINSIIVDENGELDFIAAKVLTMHDALTVYGKLAHHAW